MGMRFAVLDNDGQVIHTWDTARVAKEAIAKRAAQKAETTTVGRWPFRKTITAEPTLEKAIDDAILEFLLEVARM